MNWTNAAPGDNGTVRIPDNWLFLHYYEALSILFRIENTLRVFVYVVLKDNHKAQWSRLSISTDDGGQTTIVAAARRRAEQDATFGYLGYAIPSSLMHLTSGELIALVLSDASWPIFSDYFPATKHIVRTKLEEVGNIRNALAHFRPLKVDDVQVVRQNANQVLSRVEETLNKLFNFGMVVPTNTPDPWYTELNALSGPNINVSFQQSDDDRWVFLNLTYNCPHLTEPTVYPNARFYRVLTVLTPPMLNAAPALRDNAIFASEFVPYAAPTEDTSPDFSKTIHFYFSRDSITAAYSQIKPELETLLRKITEETRLIHADNLARGEFVRTASVSVNRSDQAARWRVTTQSLHSPSSTTDPAEYWAGKPLFFGDHFLTNTESFPWMPVTISNVTFPF